MANAFSTCAEVAAAGDKPLGRSEKSSNRNLNFQQASISRADQDLSAWYNGTPAIRMRSAMHLLIVDDDRETLDGLTELLEDAGFECDGATSFEAAIAAMRASPPDVLVTDIRLQGFNGLHLVLRRPAGTYAIVMSAFPDPVLHTEAHRLGAPFLGKPVQTRQLLELLKRVHARPRDLL